MNEVKPMAHKSAGARIEEARRAAGLSQATLAQMVGIAQPTLSRIESGAAPARAELLQLIADALSVDPAELGLASASAEQATLHLGLLEPYFADVRAQAAASCLKAQEAIAAVERTAGTEAAAAARAACINMLAQEAREHAVRISSMLEQAALSALLDALRE